MHLCVRKATPRNFNLLPIVQVRWSGNRLDLYHAGKEKLCLLGRVTVGGGGKGARVGIGSETGNRVDGERTGDR
jgi:hypothetical protein